MAFPFLGIRVSGDKAIMNALCELPKRTQGKALRPALRVAAKILHAQARSNITKRSGAAAASLKVRAGKRSRKHGVSVQVITSAGWFKGDEYYVAFGELGFKLGSRKLYQLEVGPRHKLGKRWIAERKQVEGKHWIAKAIEQKGSQAREAGLQALKQNIEKEAEALARSGAK